MGPCKAVGCGGGGCDKCGGGKAAPFGEDDEDAAAALANNAA